MARKNEQVLFWRWHLYGSLEATMQMPGLNAHQQFASQRERLAPQGESDFEWQDAVFQPGCRSRFGKDLIGSVVSYEAVNRQALLAMTIALWKKDHDGALPDSLEDLAPYCVIGGRKESSRVLPVMALNDPWTGTMLHYFGGSRKSDDSDNDARFLIVASAGTPPAFYADWAVSKATDKGISFVGSYQFIAIESDLGLFSMWLPPKP